MIRFLLFDLDRTLVDRDTSVERFFADQGFRHGLAKARAELGAVFVARLLDLDNNGYGNKTAMYRQVVAEFALPSDAASEMEEEFRSDFGSAVLTFPDTHEVLMRLRSKGYILGLITNGTVRVQNAKIHATGFVDYMQTVVISEAEGIKKPAIEIFHRALHRLGATTAETVFIGDNLDVDVGGAKAAGLLPIWFAAHDGAARSPEITVRSLTELEYWLDSHRQDSRSPVPVFAQPKRERRRSHGIMNTHRAAPVFQVSNLEASLQHYKEVFGFSEDFRFGDYAGMKLGEVCLHLSGHSTHERPIGGGTVYVFCDDVDGYYSDIRARGANVKSEPKDYPYGMRDFMVVDPDGNHLAFGAESKTA